LSSIGLPYEMGRSSRAGELSGTERLGTARIESDPEDDRGQMREWGGLGERPEEQSLPRGK